MSAATWPRLRDWPFSGLLHAVQLTGINGKARAVFEYCKQRGNGIGDHPVTNTISQLPQITSLAGKVAFLGTSEAYPRPVREVQCKQTHMSWVFLAGEKVYKLKKPVRFPYLDYSTLAKREMNCRAELMLNRRLAPDVYEQVVPLTLSARGLAIGGPGEVVDWLVVMRRLDENRTLEHAIAANTLAAWQLDRVVATLVDFYRRAQAVFVSPAVHLAQWRRNLAYNKRVLLDPRFGLPAGLIERIDAALRGFFRRRARLIEARVNGRHIVDGHGDLRPEHIFIGDPVIIIDCLEFNTGLRTVDPFDEIAYLCIECERLGAGWASRYIRRRAVHALRDHLSDELFTFYRCYRAALRARLSIAHLLEPEPRTPEKWPRLARLYLRLASADAARLDRMLRTRVGR
jgi:aminoglycoside phosphotransferase family enzyme